MFISLVPKGTDLLNCVRLLVQIQNCVKFAFFNRLNDGVAYCKVLLVPPLLSPSFLESIIFLP